MRIPLTIPSTLLEKIFFCFKLKLSWYTGEGESYDVGALKIEFFGQLLKEFDTKMMVAISVPTFLS